MIRHIKNNYRAVSMDAHSHIWNFAALRLRLVLKKAGERMDGLSEKKLQILMMEVLHMERKNLRTKEKDDGKMADIIAKAIISYANQRY